MILNDEPSSDAWDEQLVPLSTIERLLSPEFEPGSAGNRRPSFFIGRLPEDMSVEIPIPDGTSIVGSRPLGDGPRSEVEVVLDADMTAEQVREAYRCLMTEADWSESDRHRGPLGSGFVSSAPPDVLLFCKGERGPALFVRAREQKDAPTDVRLSLITDERRSPCSPKGPEHHGLFESILPALEPPPGTLFLPRSAGGGDDDVESTAILETDLDLADIGAHYVAQLRSAGWTLTGKGQEGPQAWSAWSFSDEENRPWIGLLVALRLPEPPRQHFLQIHARRRPYNV